MSQATRETVDAVRVSGGVHVTYAQLGARLKLDRSTITRRVKVAIEKGFLRNEEDRKGRAARLVPGDPMPDEQQVLPEPESLVEDDSEAAAGWGCAGVHATQDPSTPRPTSAANAI